MAPNTKWAMSDHQGTIKDIVDYNPATGVATVDSHRKYDPFGDRRGTAAPTDIVFGYTGKYFDEVTGLQNNWNRWYDPKQGRFISQDPIGFAGGDENLYRYVGNGPTNATDPSGLQEIESLKGDLEIYRNRLTFALLAQGSYTGVDTRRLMADFDYNLLADSPNGLRAARFIIKSDGMVFISFAGTEMSLTDLRDLRHDVYNGLAGASSQYSETIKLVERMIAEHGRERITLVGHSLGGGLASTAALYHDLPAITFNSAGVNPIAIRGGKRSLNQDQNITAYVVKGEILNTFQWAIPLAMPDIRGRVIELPRTGKSSGKLHMMVPLIDRIELEIRVTEERIEKLEQEKNPKQKEILRR
jgi:RHS repeat-associated protein